MTAPTHRAAPPRPRHWQRFTVTQPHPALGVLRHRGDCLVWSLQSIEIIPEFSTTPRSRPRLFVRMWRSTGRGTEGRAHGAGRNPAHRDLGTIIAVVLAGLVSLLVARNITRSWSSTPSAGSSWSRRGRCMRWSGRCSSWRLRPRSARRDVRDRGPFIGFTANSCRRRSRRQKPGRSRP